MSDGARDDDAPEDLGSLVADLEATLRELRAAADDDGRARPRPPSVTDLVRFTERYTIPTLVASLEATIQALELFRGVLRLADPERDLADDDREGDRGGVDVAGEVAGETGRRAAAELRRRLETLRDDLAAADRPRDDDARDLLAEARDLAAELDARLADGPGEAASGGAADDGGVVIDVAEAGDEGAAADEEGDPEVDVEAELDSIKADLRDEGDGDDGADLTDAEATDPAEDDEGVDGDESDAGDAGDEGDGNGES